jgi:hypothetical protein
MEVMKDLFNFSIISHDIKGAYILGLDWWLSLLITLTHDSWLRFTVHCYTYTHTDVLSLLQSPVVIAW